LRQRVAFALSQILVTSGTDINFVYGMAKYQQIFLDNAFGNYEDILTKVTLSSVMGDYLNMVNNDKPANGVSPNENYAREMMQLFSIGVSELNQDGTRILDASGVPIPKAAGCQAPRWINTEQRSHAGSASAPPISAQCFPISPSSRRPTSAS
jgi:Protein of unknown function (DUF1800)